MKNLNRIAYVACMLVLARSLQAQQAASSQPTTAVPTDDSVVQLSVFRVDSSKDDGYVATQAAGATRTKTPLIELPHSVQVLNKEFIQDTGSDRIWDALRYVSNITGGDNRNDGDFGGIFVRGYQVNRFRDGLPFASANALVELSGYERVEVVKGASAVLMGSSNPGGSMNYVTKEPAISEKRVTQLRLQAGDYSYLKGTIDTMGPISSSGSTGAYYRLVVTGENSESPFPFQHRDLKYAQGSVLFRLGRDTMALVRVENQTERTGESIGNPYQWTPPGGGTPVLLNLPLTFYRGEPTDYKYAQTTIGSLRIDHLISRRWSIHTNSSWTNSFTNRNETFIGNQTNVITVWPRTLQQVVTKNTHFYSEANLLGQFDIGATHHRVLAGVTGGIIRSNGTNQRRNLSPDFNPLDPVYGGYTLGPLVLNQTTVNAENTLLGIYAEDQVKVFSDRLILNVGTRKDRSTRPKAEHQSWRYSALFRLTDGLSLYASSNDSYLPPPGGRTFAGEPFLAITAQQLEAGVKMNLFGGKVYGSAAVFTNAQQNVIVADLVNLGFNLQKGEVTSEGFEVDLGLKPTKSLQIITSFGLISSKVTKDTNPSRIGLKKENVPEQMASLWGKYTSRSGPTKGLGLGLGLLYQSERPGNPTNTFYVPGFVIANGYVSHSWGRYRAQINVENIFDREYVQRIESERLYNPGKPRTIKGTLVVTF